MLPILMISGVEATGTVELPRQFGTDAVLEERDFNLLSCFFELKSIFTEDSSVNSNKTKVYTDSVKQMPSQNNCSSLCVFVSFSMENG